MKHIVVGVTGHDLQDPGLAWALQEAAVVGAEVVAVHVDETAQLPVRTGALSRTGSGGDSRTRPTARDRLELLVEQAREQLPSTTAPVLPVVESGDATRHLLVAAQDAHLLVLTRLHVSALDRLVHGSTLRRVLREQPCAVAVVPRDWRPGEFSGRVLVGVDGSAASLRALSWAADEAQRRAVPLVPVLVRPTGDSGLGADRLEPDQARLARWAAGLARPARIEPHVLVGDPGQLLCTGASPDDLLVVARTGDGAAGVTERVAGSVALHAARHAPCPVVITAG